MARRATSRPVPRAAPAATPHGAIRPRLLRLALAAAVFMATILAFRPAIEGEFLNWDDPSTLVTNEAYRGLSPAHLRWMFTTGHMGHYQPLAWISFAIDWLTWGLRPRGFHLTSVLLHAANAALLFLLALQLLPRRGADAPARPGVTAREAALPAAAAFAALAFSLHPMRVESVAWLTERRDVLCGTFLIASVAAYTRYVRASPPQRAWWYGLTMLLFVAAALSKALAVALPVVLLVLDGHPFRRLSIPAAAAPAPSAPSPMQPPPAAWARLSDRPIARAVLEKLPMFAISILFGVIILAVQSRAELMAPIDRHPPAARLAQAIYGLAYYPRRLLWPVDLLPLYELPARIDPLAMPILLSAAGIATCAAVLIAFRRRLRALIAAGAIYVVIVAPVLGWLQTGTQLVADRYSYLSCIALAVVAGGGVLALLRSGRAMVRLLTVIAAAVLLVTLGIMSHRYATAWQTSRSLWAYATRSGRESPTAHNNYGAALLAAGEHDAAIEQFRSAIALRPWHANAWFNIGRAEAERGDLPAAEASIRSGLAYMPGNAAARLMLAECLLLSGRESEAALELQAALRDDPTLEPARRRLEQIAPRLINAPP